MKSVLSWLVDTLEITSYGLFMVWDKDERLPKHETNDIETARYIRLRMEGSTHPFKEEYGDPPESLMEEVESKIRCMMVRTVLPIVDEVNPHS